VYSVETVTDAQEEIASLPATALASFAELMAMLEMAPWSGDAYSRRGPTTNMRAHPFGAHAEGLAIYLIVRPTATSPRPAPSTRFRPRCRVHR
jgi:hypothetical protein